MDQPSPGETFLGKYEVVERLGQGGMAEVWLAVEPAFGGRRVALKVPLPDAQPEERKHLRQRFAREVKVCAALMRTRAPNIVASFTAEPWQDGLVLVMDYMAGGDLAARIAGARGGLPLDDALVITRQVLAALIAAHEHPMEIVHRDISPDNLLFDEAGVAHLSDFGIAQVATRSENLTALLGSAVYGKAGYAAPEVLRGDGGYVPPAADVYSLGCVVFEMLTGQRPQRHRAGTPPSSLRADVPETLDAWLLRALAPDPYDRWPDARGMVEGMGASDSSGEDRMSMKSGSEDPMVKVTVPELVLRPPARRPEAMTVELAPGVAMNFVRVPAGEFVMGSALWDSDSEANEQPQRRVHLDEYWMGKGPVTVVQFEAFVAATGFRTALETGGTAQVYRDRKWWSDVTGVSWQYPEGPTSAMGLRADHPVTLLTWEDAREFCLWAAGQAKKPIRLATEAEWEKAARGTDARQFPWGNDGPELSRCNYGRRHGGTTTVGRFSPAGDSPFGCLDMSGNVWEWVADWYSRSYYAKAPEQNPSGPSKGTKRVTRGGSWSNNAKYVRAARRGMNDPGSWSALVGFRCACSA